MGETYYDRLDVATTASTDEIETAYREKLKETHPDVSTDRKAEERTRRLIEAKEILTDEDERARYDRLGHDRYVAVEGQVTADSTGTTSTTPAQSSDTTDAGESTRNAGQTTGRSETTASTDSTATDSTATDSTATGNGGTARRAQWYQGSGRTTERNSRETGSRGGTGPTSSSTRADDNWRAWNTGAAYAVTGTKTVTGWNFSKESSVLLAVTLVVYPILILGALYPEFPLVVRFIVGLCLVLTVAFLQSQPEVAIVVFGIWTLLLPVAVLLSDFSLLGYESFIALVAVAFPLGLSIMTKIAIRPTHV